MQAARITPPLRGSRRDGAVCRRSGGGPTRRRVSEIQRWVGGAGVGPPPQKPSPCGSTSATPPQGGSDRRAKPHPGARASRPQPYSWLEVAERQRDVAGRQPPCRPIQQGAVCKYHSPLEGESARQGRMPAVEPVGGTRGVAGVGVRGERYLSFLNDVLRKWGGG